MKFGKKLQREAIEAWKLNYVDYDHLKRLLKTLLKEQQDLKVAKSIFSIELEKQKVQTSTFYQHKKVECERTSNSLIKSRKKFIDDTSSLTTEGFSTQLLLIDSLTISWRTLWEELSALKKFGELNSIAFDKILKKFDKHIIKIRRGSVSDSEESRKSKLNLPTENQIKESYTKENLMNESFYNQTDVDNLLETESKETKLLESSKSQIIILKENMILQTTTSTIGSPVKSSSGSGIGIMIEGSGDKYGDIVIIMNRITDNLNNNNLSLFNESIQSLLIYLINNNNLSTTTIPNNYQEFINHLLYQSITTGKREISEILMNGIKLKDDDKIMIKGDINMTDDMSRSLLHVTHPDCIDLLINNISNNNNNNNDNDIDESNIMIKSIDIYGKTPLHYIVTTDISRDSLCYLLDKFGGKESKLINEIINIKDYNKMTPLTIASSKGKGDIVEILMRYGSDPRIRNMDNNTLLHLSTQIQSVETVYTILHLLNSGHYNEEIKGDIINGLNAKHQTALYIATKLGNTEIVKLLINLGGADISIQNADGSTPLHISASIGDINTLRILIENSTNNNNNNNDDSTNNNIDFTINKQDLDGYTPLHRAAQEDKEECALYLIEKGASRDIMDNDNWTAEVYSAYIGNLKLSNLLKSNINPMDLINDNLLLNNNNNNNNGGNGTSSGGVNDGSSSSSNKVGYININSPSYEHSSVSLSSTSSTTPTSSATSSPTITSTSSSSSSSSTTTTKTLLCLVEFRVRAKTSIGQYVAILGDRKILGSWEPLRALPMTKIDNITTTTTTTTTTIIDNDNDNDDESYNTWMVKVQLPYKVSTRYRYIISEGSQILKWESLPNKRSVTPVSPGKILLIDDGEFGISNNNIIVGGNGGNGGNDNNIEPSVDEGWIFSDTQLRIRFLRGSGAINIYQSPVSNTTTTTTTIMNNNKPIKLKVTVVTRDPVTIVHQLNFPLGPDEEDKEFIIPRFILPSSNQMGTSLHFDIYQPISGGKSDKPEILLGRSIVHSKELIKLKGTITSPIINTMLDMIGDISFHFLVIKPFISPNGSNGSNGSGINLSKSLVNTYWKSTAVIGHRGGGAEYASKIGKFHRTHIQENTLLSFVTAGSFGAEYVEFDVQLTKDKVPVIYHNFTIPDPESDSGIEIPISSITLKQFKSLRAKKKKLRNMTSSATKSTVLPDSNSNTNKHTTTTTTNRLSSPQGALQRTSITEVLSHSGSADSEKSSSTSKQQQQEQQSQPQPRIHRSRSLDTPIPVHAISLEQQQQQQPEQDDEENDENSEKLFIEDSFPTLEECFKVIPISVGFNIEVKYPLPEYADKKGLSNIKERNEYVDEILKIVFNYSSSSSSSSTSSNSIDNDRKIIFSSFDPDICTMLSVKQPKYPVFFLTHSGNPNNYIDIRCNSIYHAIQFAKYNKLIGLVCESTPLINYPQLILIIKKSGLILGTYGSLNNDIDNVKLQEKLGVDAIIVDHVAHISKHFIKQ